MVVRFEGRFGRGTDTRVTVSSLDLTFPILFPTSNADSLSVVVRTSMLVISPSMDLELLVSSGISFSSSFGD